MCASCVVAVTAQCAFVDMHVLGVDCCLIAHLSPPLSLSFSFAVAVVNRTRGLLMAVATWSQHMPRASGVASSCLVTRTASCSLK